MGAKLKPPKHRYAGRSTAGKTDRKAVIAEALGMNLSDNQIIDTLCQQGLSEQAARLEVERAQKDPLFQLVRTMARRVSKRDWTLDIYSRLAAHEQGGLTLPTVDAIAPDRFFNDYYFRNRPVKLTGIVDHWDALQKWSLQYFRLVAGKAMVEAQVGRQSNPQYEIDKDSHRKLVPLGQILDLLAQDTPSNDYYLTAYNSDSNGLTLKPLWKDLGPVSILENNAAGQDGFFWLGPKGTLTPYHHDLTNNLLVQVLGRKRVRMVPSWEVAIMRNCLHCFSDWQLPELVPGPDDGRRPPVLECLIEPGEAIFLPVGWWHHVEALDLSASMSFTNFKSDNDFYSNYSANGPM